MTRDELDVILEKHEKWLNNEDGGERADLSQTNLSGADLWGVDLSYANLSYADLRSASLRNVDLRDANLSYTDLSEVDLSESNLSGANTQGIKGFKIYSLDNIGSFKGKVTYIPKYDKVFAGCWEGTLEDFLIKGLEVNVNNEKEKRNIEMAYNFFINNRL